MVKSIPTCDVDSETNLFFTSLPNESKIEILKFDNASLKTRVTKSFVGLGYSVTVCKDLSWLAKIFSAICDSFSHGANDVANAIGPFAAIYTIYNSDGDLSKKLDLGSDAYWILGIGGVGIAIGLVVYGKKIIFHIKFGS